jgi:hypothetical protein
MRKGGFPFLSILLSIVVLCVFAAGCSGAGNELEDDGKGVWKLVDAPPFGAVSNLANCVGYGDKKFIVAGYPTNKVAVSENGSEWDVVSIDGSIFGENFINSIAYGDNKWIMAGNTGKMAVSVNGTEWTAVDSSFGTSNISTVAYGNGLWVAGGSAGKIAVSADGTNWEQLSSTTVFSNSIPIAGLVCGNGTWIAVGSSSKIGYSSNGRDWNGETWADIFQSVINVIWDGKIFIAGGSNGKAAVSSDGGVTWTPVTSTFANTNNLNGMAYGNGMYVIGGGHGEMASSSDGTKWQKIEPIFSYAVIVNGIAYGDEVFVAIATTEMGYYKF